MNAPTHSPWGQVQQSKELAPGIVSVYTASHGGILLSRERDAVLQLAVGGFRCFNDNLAAYEEDCDWAAVAVVFPEHFEPRAVAGAIATIEAAPDYFKRVHAYLKGPKGDAARAKAGAA